MTDVTDVHNDVTRSLPSPDRWLLLSLTRTLSRSARKIRTFRRVHFLAGVKRVRTRAHVVAPRAFSASFVCWVYKEYICIYISMCPL